MLLRRAALAVVTSASLLGVMGGAATACSHSYAANDAAADAGADVTQEVDAAVASPEAAAPDAVVPPTGRVTVVLASGYAALTSVATDDKNVYFCDQGAGGVHVISIDGGIVSDLTTVAGAPTAIVVTGGFVYWSDTAGGTVGRVSTSGGTTMKVAISGNTPRDVAAASGRILALTANDSTGSGRIEQFGPDLTADPAGPIASLVNPLVIAARGTTMYWTEGAPSNAVASAAVGSTSRVALTMSELDGESITTDATGALYWTSAANGLIRTRSVDGVVRTLVALERAPGSLAADETGLYWVTFDGTLRRKRVDQELPPETLAAGFRPLSRLGARGIALTSAYVVWLTEDGMVLRIAK